MYNFLCEAILLPFCVPSCVPAFTVALPGVLFNLLVKDKLLCWEKVPVNAKERQLIMRPLRSSREKRGYSRWELYTLATSHELPSPQDVDPIDAHLARTFVISTAQRLTEQETIPQSIKWGVISSAIPSSTMASYQWDRHPSMTSTQSSWSTMARTSNASSALMTLNAVPATTKMYNSYSTGARDLWL